MKDRVQKTLRAHLSSASRLATVALLGMLAAAGAARAQVVHAYVASQGNSRVLVIDTATNTTTATVTGVSIARAVTLSPDHAFVYATTANGMDKIDTATNTIISTVMTGNNPVGIALTSNGATAYVANNATGTVSAVDTATMTVTATLPIFPQAIATTPDGSAIWVSANILTPPSFPAVMYVIDPATNTFTTFPLGHGSAAPGAIAFTPNGAFAYLANFQANIVSVIDTATQTEVATITAGNRPFYVALTPGGAFAYVANLLSNDVSIIDTTTNAVVATVPVGAFPRALAFTPDGASAYVTNFNDNTISVIDTATQAVTTTFAAGSHPWGIVIGALPPDCSQAVASPNLLWPPNHKFVPIQVTGVTNPGGGPVTITVTSIFQDEPVTDGPDGTGVGTSTASVRAERDGGGDGRVYHISFTATNASGGSCTGAVTVGVPHDQGPHGGPVDEGPLYDSTQP
jgi:YVTN family beta-propeller protein